MSSLYQTPSEIQKEIAKRTSTGNWLQDTFTDWASEGIRMGDDGRVERDGAAWWLQGLTPGAESIATQKQKLDESRAIDNAVQKSGLTDGELRKALGDGTLTSSNVRNTINKATRIIADTPSTMQQYNMDRTDRNDKAAVAAQQDATALGRETLAATQENKRTDRLMQSDQFAHTSQQQGLDRALTRDLANQSEDFKMQMAFMNADLQDKRMAYDRETRSMDKRDRMIAQLMSGLGQLGGAFAL